MNTNILYACCRNNWHIHHHAVQVLTCVSGRGWYQEWGKEPVELTPGMVVTVPAGTKHWHGAAAPTKATSKRHTSKNIKMAPPRWCAA